MPANTNTVFDTLVYARKLEDAGFTPKQSEVQALALAEVIDERLATKEDIRRLEETIEQIHLKIETLHEETKKDIAASRLAAETTTALIRKDTETDTALIRKDIEQIHLKIEQIHLSIEALRLATEKDIKQINLNIEAFRLATEKDIEAARLAAEKDTKQLEKQMDLKLAAMRSSMIIWLGSIVVASTVASVGILATLITLIN